MKRLGLTPVLCAVPLAIIAVCVAFSTWLVPDATRQDVLTGVVPAGSEELRTLKVVIAERGSAVGNVRFTTLNVDTELC